MKIPRLLPAALVGLGLVGLFIGARVLSGDTARIFSGASVLLLLAAVAARGFVYSVAPAGAAKKAEQWLLAGYGGVALALGFYLLSKRVTPGSDLEVMATVGWFVALFVSCVTLLLMEITYARMPNDQSIELRRIQSAAAAGLAASLCIVFVSSTYYAANERDVRKDLSYFRMAKPDAATVSMVRGLDKPVKVYLFFMPGNEVLGQVRAFFSELDRASDKFSVRVADYALEPELVRKYHVGGNGVVLFVVGEGESAQGQIFSIGESFANARTELRKLDASIQERLSQLVEKPRKVYFTAGHGERTSQIDKDQPPEEQAKQVRALLRRFNIGMEDLGLGDGLATGVPEDASAVVIVGPMNTFTEAEANTLLQYVRKGGRLMTLVDPDVDHGLAPLLSGLGVELEPGVLVSEQHYYRLRHTDADKAVVLSSSYSSHPTVTTAQKQPGDAVASAFVRGGSLKQKQTPTGARVTFSLRGMDSFFRDLNGDYLQGDGEAKDKTNMIAAVTFPASGGQPEGRAVVVGDGDFVSDLVVQNPGNFLVFVDSLRWLIGEDQIRIDTVSEEDVPIQHTRDEDKIWFYGTTFGAPIPVLLAGLVVTLRRRRRSEAKR